MYLLPIPVPIFVDGDATYVNTDWKRGLCLLRDSLQGRYGQIVVVAPRKRVSENSGLMLERLCEKDDGVRLVASVPREGRARDYWLRTRQEWLRDVTELVAQARVVHAGLDTLWRPLMFDAYRVALRMKKPTVYVQDTDIAAIFLKDARAAKSIKQRLGLLSYGHLYDRANRWGMKRAGLVLLKDRSITDRIGYTRDNVRYFLNSSHSTEDVIETKKLEARLREREGRLRFVYAGRLIPYKGLEDSLKIVRQAREAGVKAEFTIIGDGPLRKDLEAASVGMGLGDVVKFRPGVAYSKAFLEQLAEHDAMLFSPLRDDTPRMVFDGYAKGLPIVSVDIPFMKIRAAEDRCVLTFNQRDIAAGANAVRELATKPGMLEDLSARACEAGVYHAAESWYGKRAEWTFEMMDRFERGHSAPGGNGLLQERGA